MIKLVLIQLTLLAVITVQAQNDSFSKAKESITVAELRDHVFYLASDSMKGRMSGTSEYNVAANYAISQFIQAGLKPGYTDPNGNASFIQPFDILSATYDEINSKFEISIEGKKYFKNTGKDILMFSGNNFERETLNGDVVFVGYGINEPDFGWDDYNGIDVKDKWIVLLTEIHDSVLQHFPSKVASEYKNPRERLLRRINSALQLGAIGTISILPKSKYKNWNIIEDVFENSYVGSLTKHTSCDNILIDTTSIKLLFQKSPFNPIEMVGDYGSFQLDNVEINFEKKFNFTTIKSCNILALKEGTDPILKNEIITVGAHLDHIGTKGENIYNGANDNATGCAAILEIGEAIAEIKTNRSILFILFGGEEVGLLGSNHFVKNYDALKADLKLNLNIDGIGLNDRSDILSVVGADRINPIFKDQISSINEKTENLELDFSNMEYINAGDHYSFYLEGIPSAFFTDAGGGVYHTINDDADNINYNFLQKNCFLLYELTLDMSNNYHTFK